MDKDIFNAKHIKTSDCPPDFIPSGAKAFTTTDEDEKGKECTITGFYEGGVCHIQSIQTLPK